MKISVTIPTRGDVDMTPITSHLKTYPEVDDIHVIVGDTPFNRYQAIEKCKHQVIFTQDDDCITDIRPLIDAYEPGVLVNAMTRSHARLYTGRQTLVGFGSLFHRKLADVFKGWKRDSLFFSKSDRIFGTVNPHKTVFPSITILPHADAPNRMFRSRNHYKQTLAMNRRILKQTGIEA